MAEVRVHLWNGTMARARRMDIKALVDDDGMIRVVWYGSGYDADPWAPHWLRTNSPARAVAEMRALVEAQPQYQWREVPV